MKQYALVVGVSHPLDEGFAWQAWPPLEWAFPEDKVREALMVAFSTPTVHSVKVFELAEPAVTVSCVDYWERFLRGEFP